MNSLLRSLRGIGVFSLLLFLFAVLLWPATAAADAPTWTDIWRVLSLRDYNTRVVVVGTTLMGAGSGVIGVFLLLRKRALMSDVISHATLPGIGIAFLLMVAAGGTGKNFLALLLGAAVTGTIGMLLVMGISRWTRIKDNAALAIVLSTSFALGISLLGIASGGTGHAAGLETYIYGKTASMLLVDAKLIAGIAAIVTLVCIFLTKEFTILCFDQAFAETQGWPTLLLDLLLMALVVLITVVGLQAVGLILVVAMLIVPPAAARFWSHRLQMVLILSASFGALSAFFGCLLSAMLPNLPAGAIIVLCSSAFFAVSLLVGSERGVLHTVRKRVVLSRRISEQHLLRAMIEIAEAAGHHSEPWRAEVSVAQLDSGRAWPKGQLAPAIRKALREKLIVEAGERGYRLTQLGVTEARRVVRNHRLWELYLIAHADIAPSHVDRDADMVEHILDADMISELEEIMDREKSEAFAPPSPHELNAGGIG